MKSLLCIFFSTTLITGSTFVLNKFFPNPSFDFLQKEIFKLTAIIPAPEKIDLSFSKTKISNFFESKNELLEDLDSKYQLIKVSSADRKSLDQIIDKAIHFELSSNLKNPSTPLYLVIITSVLLLLFGLLMRKHFFSLTFGIFISSVLLWMGLFLSKTANFTNGIGIYFGIVSFLLIIPSLSRKLTQVLSFFALLSLVVYNSSPSYGEGKFVVEDLKEIPITNGGDSTAISTQCIIQ